jgi:hypothetical protein
MLSASSASAVRKTFSIVMDRGGYYGDRGLFWQD